MNNIITPDSMDELCLLPYQSDFVANTARFKIGLWARQTGQVLYRAHSTPDGHADRTTALALAVRAAQTALPRACATIVRARPQPYGGPRRYSRFREPEPRRFDNWDR